MFVRKAEDEEGKSYCLSQALRDKLRLDSDIGAGNFLYYALKVSPLAARKLLYLDKPFVSIAKKEYEAFSLEELYELAILYASWYLAQGIRAKDPVAIYLEDGVDYLLHYIALTSIGAIPALLNGSLKADILIEFVKKIGGVMIVTDTMHHKKLVKEMKQIPLDIVCYVMNEINVSESKYSLPDWYPYTHVNNDPIMITHSSGTTGVPKAVTLTHGSFFYGIRHLLSMPLMSGIERLLSSLPSSHNSSIAYSMYSLLSGAELLIVSNRLGKAVLKKIDQFAPTVVVSFPQTYVEMTELDMENYNLSSVNYWINSGDSAHEPHIKRLIQFGCHYRAGEKVKGSQFVDGLGSSEMGHTLFRVIHTPYTNNYDRCIGFPQKWVEAAVLDEQGNELPLHTPGMLGVKSPSITSGYWNDSVLTHRSLLKGYWLTGDIVMKNDLGCYFHLDRIPDVIQTENAKIFSVQMEEWFLKEIDELADCTVVGRKEGELIVPFGLFRLKANVKIDKATLLKKCNQILDKYQKSHLLNIELVTFSKIPLGVTGKVLKRLIREEYENKDKQT